MTAPSPYPSYVNHMTQTFDKLPNGWLSIRARHLVRIRTGSGDTVDAEPGAAYPFYVRSDKPLRSDRWEFDTTAVLTAGDGAGVAKVFHLVGGKFMAHQRVYVLDDFKCVTPRYFFYAFSSLFHQMALDGSAKSTVDSVRRAMIADMPFPVPSEAEQFAIVAFLDRETARIDALIAEQQHLMETLAERRAAVVDSVVTTGLSAIAPKRDSGVDWIGLVPAHWELRPLWSMFRRNKDVDHPHEQMLSVFRDYGVVAKDSRKNINQTAENRNIYQLVHPGWLVSNRMKAWQGSVGISSLRGIVSGHYICFAPLHHEDHDYLNLLFRSARYAVGYGLISRGVRIGQAEIDNDDYRVLPVVVPPLDEQEAIVTYLHEQTLKIDLLIEETETLIKLGQERRSALITAAVTGQIDVRKVAA